MEEEGGTEKEERKRERERGTPSRRHNHSETEKPAAAQSVSRAAGGSGALAQPVSCKLGGGVHRSSLARGQDMGRLSGGPGKA